MSNDKPLVVVGGGPKAAAIAAKRYALVQDGCECPQIVILEKNQIAANWDGNHGYTNGSQRLGTPPEKDVGFPYGTTYFSKQVIETCFTKFSWHSYKIFHESRYGEWIDRGRPHPTHEEWANYIRWVISRSGCETILGCVTQIEQIGEGWTVVYSTDGEKKSILACGVVITGPGPSKKPQNINVPRHPYLLYGDNFWEKADWVGNLRYNEDVPVVVVGGGETAASVVSTLIDIIGRRRVPIVVLTRGGTIFSRGEGYHENRMFTDHESWSALSEDIRQEVIDRTDRGVFSVEVARKIALAHNVDHRAIEITGVEVDANEHNILNIKGKDGYPIDCCQLLVLAFGFDAYWFTQLLDARTREAFADESKRKQVEKSLRNDLSVNDEHVQGKLHLPMLAGLKQGPGFPNLSCLGHLADVIVKTYV